MALDREYEQLFAVMMGMAMLMAAGTTVAVAGDTERSKPLGSLAEPTTQAPFLVNMAKITELKSRLIPVVFADITISDRASLREAILFLFFLLSLTFLVILCMNRGFRKVIFTCHSI